MKALVTGGGGFLGSHLVERLEAEGHDAIAARHDASTGAGRSSVASSVAVV